MFMRFRFVSRFLAVVVAAVVLFRAYDACPNCGNCSWQQCVMSNDICCHTFSTTYPNFALVFLPNPQAQTPALGLCASVGQWGTPSNSQNFQVQKWDACTDACSSSAPGVARGTHAGNLIGTSTDARGTECGLGEF